ncbi:hypothetical protein [Sphingomonas montana]|uniref:hypothetical protein n=1 Tax=Sphingomonas montana TaxID=1843236 RepID=UPI00101AED15|nr:hypothetical protein [Sphingomonas montana]
MPSEPDRPEDGAGPATDEVGRLYQEVRALRAQIAARDADAGDRPATTRTLVGIAAGGVMLAVVILATGVLTDGMPMPRWNALAGLVGSRTAAGIVERIFTVY